MKRNLEREFVCGNAAMAQVLSKGMKRNLKEEYLKIQFESVKNGEALSMKHTEKVLSLFSTTLDDVIEQAKPIYIDRGNTVGDRKAGREEATKEYEQNLRARKKLVLSDKEGDYLKKRQKPLTEEEWAKHLAYANKKTNQRTGEYE